MAAGATNRLWSIEGVVDLVEKYRKERAKAEREEHNERSYSQFGNALGGKGLKQGERKTIWSLTHLSPNF